MPMIKNKMTSISLQNLEFMVECRHCIYGHSDLLIYPSNRLSGVAETLVIYFYKSHATIFPTDIDLCVYKTDICYVQLPNQAHSSNIYCPAHHTSPPTQDFHPLVRYKHELLYCRALSISGGKPCRRCSRCEGEYHHFKDMRADNEAGRLPASVMKNS